MTVVPPPAKVRVVCHIDLTTWLAGIPDRGVGSPADQGIVLIICSGLDRSPRHALPRSLEIFPGATELETDHDQVGRVSGTSSAGFPFSNPGAGRILPEKQCTAGGQ